MLLLLMRTIVSLNEAAVNISCFDDWFFREFAEEPTFGFRYTSSPTWRENKLIVRSAPVLFV